VKRVGVAADDYGTGYASLKQLRHIPVSELKIDQSFVRGAHTDERKRVMLASTVALARELGLATVAEGVETEGELELLRSIDCEYVQGFFFSNRSRDGRRRCRDGGRARAPAQHRLRVRAGLLLQQADALRCPRGVPRRLTRPRLRVGVVCRPRKGGLQGLALVVSTL